MAEEFDKIKGRIESHERTLLAQITEISIAHDEIREMKQKLISLENRITALEGKVSDADKNIVMLRRILIDMKNAIEVWLKVYE